MVIASKAVADRYGVKGKRACLDFLCIEISAYVSQDDSARAEALLAVHILKIAKVRMAETYRGIAEYESIDVFEDGRHIRRI